MLLVVTRGKHYKHCVVSRFSFHILWNSVCWFRICRVGGQHWTYCTYIFSTMPAVTFRIGNVGWLNFCCYRSQVKSVRCNFKSLYHYLSWHVNNFLKINFLGVMLLSLIYLTAYLLIVTLLLRGTKWLLNWQNFRRFYLYVMTESMKSIILRHRHVLLHEDVKRHYNLNEREIIAAATLPELDDAYTRWGFVEIKFYFLNFRPKNASILFNLLIIKY